MVNAGTPVRVLDDHGLVGQIVEIRILEGEFEGRRGFISAQRVAEK